MTRLQKEGIPNGVVLSDHSFELLLVEGEMEFLFLLASLCLAV